MTPAHKQTDPKKKAGQIVNPVDMVDHPAAWPFPEKTLAEYVKKKQAAMGETPKMTFDEWWNKEGALVMMSCSDDYALCEHVWYWAQRNV